MSEKVKKPIYKRIWFIVLCAVIVLVVLGSLGSEGTASDRVDEELAKQEEANKDVVTQESEAEPQETEAQETAPTETQEVVTETKIVSPKDVDWNTELYVDKNDNVQKAVDVLHKMSEADYNAHSAINVDMGTVIKKPWEYYGEFVNINGYVALMQAYPAGSDVSEMLEFNGTTTEILIMNEDGTEYTTFYYMGDATDIAENSYVTITGLPCGLVEVPNTMGGTLTYLTIVGVHKPQVMN